MRPLETLIAVFSYNRPAELDLCLRTARRHTTCRVVVFDDASTDPDVPRIASKSGVEFRVGGGGDGRLGGLYANMNTAFEEAKGGGFKFLMTLQDDMQIVRPFNAAVMAEYGTIFAADPAITQIDPRFVREDGTQVRRRGDAPAFEWIEPYRQTYSDVGIFSVERLTALAWQFEEGEKTNRARAASLGMKRVYPFTPVTMHVPFPTRFRKRTKTPAARHIRAGQYRYRDMSPSDLRRMDERPSDRPPLFRKHLRVQGLGFFDWIKYRFTPDDKVFM